VTVTNYARYLMTMGDQEKGEEEARDDSEKDYYYAGYY
jgi:hypothetical protein